MRFFRFLTLIVSFAFPCILLGQSTNASLTGAVDDPSKAVIPGVSVTAINTQTGVKTQTFTNASGQYVIPGLAPGTYRIEVDKQGFKGIIEAGLTLHVQDVVQINFHMAVGSMSETVTVNSGDVQMNTITASVSSVVDQQLISELPLNGRSLDTLFLLTPGVVATSAGAGGPGTGGGYSINGQRGSANNLTIDGASGNFYLSVNSQQGFAGTNYAESASGGTNGLLPVDAIEEYRIQSSSYSAEFGRSPGGQIQIRSKGGTNNFHGSIFEYFRNQILDATDWFVKYNHETQPPLRMNDFGGTFAGPIWKNRLFFFVANENLILDQPGSTSVGVPSALARQTTSSALQPFVVGYPLGNGGSATTAQYPQYTDIYNESYSAKIADHSVSTRFDLHLPKDTTLFYRFDIAPSQSYVNSIGGGTNTENIATHTIGLGEQLTRRMSNELTVNYSENTSTVVPAVISIGGADTGPITNFCNGQSGPVHFCVIQPLRGWSALELGHSVTNSLSQFNIVDTLRLHVSRHVISFGEDFRRVPTTLGKSTEYLARVAYSKGPSSLTGTTLNTASTFSSSVANLKLPVLNISLFAQDEWHIKDNVTLNYGVRWEYNPPISDGHGGPTAIIGDVDNPATLQPAPSYTPLYSKTFANVAPRVGIAYQVRRMPNFSTVLRAGWGIFYDTGQSATTAANAINSYPYSRNASQSNAPIATLSYQTILQTASAQTLPQYSLTVTDPKLRLPYTYEWNLAVEQQLYGASSVSVTYLGAAGEKLGSTIFYDASPSSALSTGTLDILTNNGVSNYQALQLQSTTRIVKTLDAIISYTYSHNIDNGSSDFEGPAGASRDYRGNADDDIRHAFSAGINFKPTGISGNRILGVVSKNWILNTFARLQTAPPLSVTASTYSSNPSVENTLNSFADVVPGVPVYIRSKSVPGGIQLNPSAFAMAPVDASGNTERDGNSPRNAYRLFGLKQFDLSAGRSFKIRERAVVTFKAEMFNMPNTPNFASVQTFVGGANFGKAQALYAGGTSASTQSGGLNSVFQLGGPRNVQFTTRIAF